MPNDQITPQRLSDIVVYDETITLMEKVEKLETIIEKSLAIAYKKQEEENKTTLLKDCFKTINEELDKITKVIDEVSEKCETEIKENIMTNMNENNHTQPDQVTNVVHITEKEISEGNVVSIYRIHGEAVLPIYRNDNFVAIVLNYGVKIVMSFQKDLKEGKFIRDYPGDLCNHDILEDMNIQIVNTFVNSETSQPEQPIKEETIMPEQNEQPITEKQVFNTIVKLRTEISTTSAFYYDVISTDGTSAFFRVGGRDQFVIVDKTDMYSVYYSVNGQWSDENPFTQIGFFNKSNTQQEILELLMCKEYVEEEKPANIESVADFAKRNETNEKLVDFTKNVERVMSEVTPEEQVQEQKEMFKTFEEEKYQVFFSFSNTGPKIPIKDICADIDTPFRVYACCDHKVFYCTIPQLQDLDKVKFYLTQKEIDQNKYIYCAKTSDDGRVLMDYWTREKKIKLIPTATQYFDGK